MNEEVTRHFCWYQNFVPCGLSVSAPGLYTCIKSWKKVYKIRLQEIFLKLATNDRSDKIFLLTYKFRAQGVVSPCLGAIHMNKIMRKDFVCLCWGLTSQSTIFQSCRDEATASWVINQYFRGVKCLAQGHNTAAVGIEPPTSRSGVRHSTTEPPRSPMRKEMHKIRLQRDFFETCNKWVKW